MPEPFLAGEECPTAEGSAPVSRIDRRTFLQGALAGVGGVSALAFAANSKSRELMVRPRPPARLKPRPHALPAVSNTALASGVIVPTARWLIEENAKPGTLDWIVTGVQTAHDLEGYASQVSAVQGDEITLFVNTVAQSISVQAFRMGYYQGLGSRLIYTSDNVAGTVQPAPSFAPGINTVSCEWNPSITVKIDNSWPPGNYLLKLQGNGGQQQYVPLTVRDDKSTAAFVLQNSVTTWQAYNLWGEYSLYYGRNRKGGSDFANRSRIVSFDRPYPQTWAQGAADFVGNEFPLLYHLESLGLDLTYWTDVDLHAQPELLFNHKCLFSMGHDEYWSRTMKAGAEIALSRGLNLAFLGANACYRQIRFQPSAVGPNRQQICYKSAAEDPMSTVNAALTTVNWNQDPVNEPESTLVGATYQSVGASDDLVVADPSSWFFEGCGVSEGQHLPGVVTGEYDRFVATLGPQNADVFAHSPIAHQRNYSDVTYFTTQSGGGVLASGSAKFVYKLANTTKFPSNVVPAPTPGVTEILLRAMENVYSLFGQGPAGTVQPSGGNWSNAYGANATVSQAPATNSA